MDVIIKRILFVCYGNAYRSPMAEVLFEAEVSKAQPGGFSVLAAHRMNEEKSIRALCFSK